LISFDAVRGVETNKAGRVSLPAFSFQAVARV